MALLDIDAVFQLGDAAFYHAPKGTPKPNLAEVTKLSDVPAPWVSHGGSKLEALASVAREGGETESVGIWQLPTAFTKTSPVTESMAFALAEWTTASLTRYFGENASITADGIAGASAPVPVREAFLLAIKIPGGFLTGYCDEVDVLGSDGFEFGEIGSIPTLPIKVTPKSTSGYGFRWSSPRIAALSA